MLGAVGEVVQQWRDDARVGRTKRFLVFRAPGALIFD
jgi:hypothetical protein